MLSSADHGHAAALICSCSFPTTTFFVTAFWKKAGQQSRKRPTTIFSWHFIPIGKCAESRRVIIAQGHKSSFVIFKIVWLHLLCPKNAAAFHGQPAAKAMVPSHSSWPGAITIIFSNLFSLKPFGFQRIEPQTKSTAVFRYICITTAVLLAGLCAQRPNTSPLVVSLISCIFTTIFPLLV